MEQAVNGRVFRNVDGMRAAVKAFVDRYNREWLVETIGFLSPSLARQRSLDLTGFPAAA